MQTQPILYILGRSDDWLGGSTTHKATNDWQATTGGQAAAHAHTHALALRNQTTRSLRTCGGGGRVCRGHHKVGGLDVSVNEAGAVHLLQRLQHPSTDDLHRHRQGRRQRQRQSRGEGEQL